MKTTRLRSSPCPVCYEEINKASSFDDKVPYQGDITVCLYCTSFLVFNKDLSLRILEPHELVALEDDALIKLIRLRKTIREFKRDN